MGFFRRESWNLGLVAILALLFVLTKVVQPNYGASGIVGLAQAALPFAFAAAAQAIVVIVGGIDLSIASMMAVTSVAAAVMMEGASEGQAFWIALFILALGTAMGALNGILIVLTRVPDIVVTLAMLYVWEGVALMILKAPGGGASDWLMGLPIGSIPLPGVPESVSSFLPKALLLLVVCIAVVWVPLKRSKLGLQIYAIGSSEQAAYRTGVPVKRSKVAAYAIAGLFAAMGGLVLTASTGIGAPIPGPYLLASVAAVVLGGVVLGGGRGGLLGPIIAVFILRLVRTILTFLAVDPNVTTIVEGTIMVAVVMVGGVLALRGRRRSAA
ncbi:MAG: ABC transporter permease [Albidovulum sp.]|nr:ABC transporter permease [Albidovulum sp.]MDE0531668.1 ABC transporter permease [Albidovulum sp.]